MKYNIREQKIKEFLQGHYPDREISIEIYKSPLDREFHVFFKLDYNQVDIENLPTKLINRINKILKKDNQKS